MSSVQWGKKYGAHRKLSHAGSRFPGTSIAPAIQTMRLTLSARCGFFVNNSCSGVTPATHISVIDPGGALSNVSSSHALPSGYSLGMSASTACMTSRESME